MFGKGQFEYQWKVFQKISGTSPVQREMKNEVFLQGTWEAQNFIFKDSAGLYSITKGISGIYQMERD